MGLESAQRGCGDRSDPKRRRRSKFGDLLHLRGRRNGKWADKKVGPPIASQPKYACTSLCLGGPTQSRQLSSKPVSPSVGNTCFARQRFRRVSRGTFVPVTHYRSGGKFQLPAGAWTDDTAMALGLAQSLILEKGFEPRSVLQNFSDWMEHGHYTSTGTCVGVGQNTLRTLGDFRRTGALRAVPFGKKNDGNGSLMRLAPIPCFYTSDDELVVNIAREQSLITHASEIAAEACQFLALLLSYLIRGEDYIVAKRRTLEKEWSYPLLSSVDLDYKGFSDAGIKSGGYVLETLQAAIWAVENGTDFKSIVLNAVNLGDDADTTAFEGT